MRDWKKPETLTNLSDSEALQVLAQISEAFRVRTQDEILTQARLSEARRVNDAAAEAAKYHEAASAEAAAYATIANTAGRKLRSAKKRRKTITLVRDASGLATGAEIEED
jgi:hypothetical protein